MEKLMSEQAGIGHNSEAEDQLRSYMGRIETLEKEKKIFSNDIRDIYAEAKGNGYDVKALRAIVKMRKEDADKRREREAIIETYKHALGMIANLPLGQAAIARATA